jgi:DNA-binding NarL/FixJ family response regulator
MELARVFVVDADELIRRGVRQLLTEEPLFDLVGEAATIADGARQIAESAPDVAVLAVRLPDGRWHRPVP